MPDNKEKKNTRKPRGGHLQTIINNQVYVRTDEFWPEKTNKRIKS